MAIGHGESKTWNQPLIKGLPYIVTIQGEQSSPLGTGFASSFREEIETMLNSPSSYDRIAAPWSLMTPEPPRLSPPNAQAVEKSGTQSNTKGPTPVDGKDMFGEDGLSFSDFLDVINPLQHIPLVSSLYRAVTGDEISPGARMAGGTLYGGPIGLAGAVVVNAMEEHSGSSVEERMLALFDSNDKKDTAAKQIAETETATETAVSQPTVTTSGNESAIVDLDPEMAARLNAFITASGGNRTARAPSQAAAGQPATGIAPGSVDFSHLVPKPVPITGNPEPAPANPMNMAANSAAPATGETIASPSANPIPALSSRSRLSPDIAQQLARVVHRRRALGQEQLHSQNPPPGIGTSTENPGSSAATKPERSAPNAPQTAASTQQAPIKKPERTKNDQVPSYMPDPVPLQNVPEAMKAALEKYQAMLSKP
ncbi:hypothetical protein [Aestuariispira insulae]|uniref:Uncharacterized protein n=1 Tax=Aestuariispira insulae TaxID=1461337 RepID=A0A3D9HPB2_9PROT|nr:hypothetical protein [Aestuariispira insulae]RED51344.1 hypothetical protein DFP90_103144 [Aestuariispira insulae]